MINRSQNVNIVEFPGPMGYGPSILSPTGSYQALPIFLNLLLITNALCLSMIGGPFLKRAFLLITKAFPLVTNAVTSVTKVFSLAIKV